MTTQNILPATWSLIESQPSDILQLNNSERNSLIISATKVDGRWITLSRYGDATWKLVGFTSNTSDARKILDFNKISSSFRETIKALIYRFMRRGRKNKRRPRGTTISKFFTCIQPFLKFLENIDILKLNLVTPIICTNYVAHCKNYRQSHRTPGKPLSQGALSERLLTIESLYELSQYTTDPMPLHPWPETSALAITGLIGSNNPRSQGSKTPLIPDDVFCAIFQASHELLENGGLLLDHRDALDEIGKTRMGKTDRTINIAKNRYLANFDFHRGLKAFYKSVLNLRTACYIILASTSGCRNHELANLQSGAHKRSRDDAGTVYHWMRSRSEKTYTETHDWMIPGVSVKAIRLMERWAKPYQLAIEKEIFILKKNNPQDPLIAEAMLHRNALFLGNTMFKGNQVRTVSAIGWADILKDFMQEIGINWHINSHQFRRKFASYVAHSKFGDLRYLREHYAHWSMDMSLLYAIDEDWGQYLDLDLCDEIYSELEDIKFSTVDSWLTSESLAGGYGTAFKLWQQIPENIAIFKDRKTMIAAISKEAMIRSNGHAWCTADDNRCVGNTLEQTRCSGCINAVIGPIHEKVYRKLYINLKELLHCRDIGENGYLRVLRDLARCREVLTQLGYDPESIIL